MLISVEYFYPVHTFKGDNGHMVLLMRQDTQKHMQLWLWSSATNQYEKLLSSQFNPVAVQLLPDNSGFSFMDNGLIKVKSFEKRSPKTIEIYEPIYDINFVNWIDQTHCYFHAKYGNRYGIYQVDLEGTLMPIITSKTYDCLYPQKVGTQLFFIERDLENNHRIVATKYPALVHTHMSADQIFMEYEKKDQFKKLPETRETECVINFGQQYIAFLSMISEHEGFAVGYPAKIESNDETICFQFYHMKKVMGVWKREELFTFRLLTKLIFDDNYSLCENLLYLLPLACKYGIYFHSYEKNNFLESLYYDLENKRSTVCSCDCFFSIPSQTSTHDMVHQFTSILVDDILCAGIIIDRSIKN